MSADRLARIVVRWYPRAWRSRYADEVLALLDERPATSRDAVDLASGCVRQWGTRFGGGLAQSLGGLTKLVAAGASGAVPAFGLGLALHQALPEGEHAWLFLAAGGAGLGCVAVPLRAAYLNGGWISQIKQARRFTLTRFSPTETNFWRAALLVGAAIFFAATLDANRGLWWRVLELTVVGPAMPFWMLDMYAAKPWFMPQIDRPRPDVPAHPLGLT